MPTLKRSEASLSYVQCSLYVVSSSINVTIFHITWLDTVWTDLVRINIMIIVHCTVECSRHLLNIFLLINSINSNGPSTEL